MDETKIYSKLLEHDERLERLEEKMENLATKAEMHDKLDKILHIVERLDTERATTNYKLDQNEERISKLAQQAASA
ncbi:MAG: hypothetical protein JNK33_04075 [Candidatus Doudnabacteria bacterium]|nr:hypothetical protein [Candidatus Doudnabacteria bacterium]